MPEHDPKPELTESDLAHFRERLLRKRKEVVGDVTDLQREADQRHDSDDLTKVPDHPSEAAESTRDEDLVRRLAETERKLVVDIDDALRRIEEGTYGLCEETGQPISRERLEAKPWARRTVEAERRAEQGAPGQAG